LKKDRLKAVLPTAGRVRDRGFSRTLLDVIGAIDGGQAKRSQLNLALGEV